MRKLILLSAALLVSTFSFAQFEKGDIQLGGNVTWIKSEFRGFEATTINVLPRAGLFVSNNVSVGLNIGYSNQISDVFDIQSGNLQERSEAQFLIGAYARFHKGLSDQFYLYLQPSFVIGTGDLEVGDVTTGDVSSINVGVSPGLTYFLSPKFALEMSINALTYQKVEIEGGNNPENRESYGLNLNLSNVALGINFYLK